MAPAWATVLSQARVMPASFPRTTPCHLSGRLSSLPGVMSYVRRRPRRWSARAASLSLRSLWFRVCSLPRRRACWERALAASLCVRLIFSCRRRMCLRVPARRFARCLAWLLW